MGPTTADASGHWSFTPTLADGAHTIVASETDTAGNSASATLSFTLDTTAPAVSESLGNDTGASATDRITNDPTLTGSGDPNAVVTFTEGNTILGTTTADSSGHWSFTPTLAAGAHTAVATQTVTAANRASTRSSF